MQALIDHASEIAALAAECGIDWYSIRDLSTGIHKKPPVTAQKYRDKAIMWVEEHTTKSGKEFIKLTFHTKKHGGITRVWTSLGQREFQPRLRPTVKIPNNEDERRKELFIAYKSDFQQSPQVRYFPYLERKGITAIVNHMDIRLSSDTKVFGKKYESKPYICYPLYNLSGNYVGLQRIYEDGTKKLTSALISGQYNGAHALIGKPNGRIYIAEGFATAAAIHLTTGDAVAIAVSANNLDAVTAHLKSRYEDCKVIVAADDDISSNGNTGVFKALEAAKKNRVRVVVPPSLGSGKTDFNDLAVAFGFDALKTILEDKANLLIPAKNYLDYILQLIPYAKTQELIPLIKRAAFAAKIPHLMTTEVLHQLIENAVESRISAHHITKAIRAVQVAGHYKAQEISSISSKSVDTKWSFATEQKNGLWVLSDDCIKATHAALKSGATVIVKSPMGTGKTEGIIKTEMQCVERAALVLPRISIVDDAVTRLGIDHYRCIDEVTIYYTNQFATCINSLGADRFQSKKNEISWFENLDLLCLDEASQAIPQIATLGNPSRRKKNHSVLSKAMKTARAVLICDADANEFLVAELRNLNPERKIILIDVAHPVEAEQAWNVQFSESLADTQQELLKAIASGEKCLLATDNRTKACILEQLIKTLFPNKRVLNIHREPSREDELKVRAFYENPNKECENYDVLMFSPAITSGVSITSNYFTRHFAIFSGVVKVNDIIQMMGRDRTAIDWLLTITPKTTRLNPIDMAKALEDNGDEVSDYANMKFSAANYEHDARQNLVVLCLNILKLKGHRIHVSSALEQKLDKNLKKLMSEIGADLKDERIVRIMEQGDITEAQYNALKSKWLQNAEDSAAIQAYRIRHMLCSNVTPKAIEFMDDGGLRKIALFETIHANDHDLRRFDTNERLTVDPSDCYRAEDKRRVIMDIMALLNLESETFNGEFTHKQCQLVVSYCLKYAGLMNLLFPDIINLDYPPRCATSFVMKILNLLGLEVGKRKSNGRMIRFITETSIDQMQFYLQRRSEKSVSFIHHEDVQQNAA